MNVLERANLVIFVDNFRGNLAGDDFSKKSCHNASIFDIVAHMSKKLFVGNLPFDVNDADLVTVLSVAGEVVTAKVIINRKSGRSKGYAFVEMATEEMAKEAIAKFEGATLNERPLTVQLATPKQEADAKSEAASEAKEAAGDAHAAETPAVEAAASTHAESPAASDSPAATDP